MARITVEDCIDKVQNRFELVILAAERGKDINSGVQITLDRGNDKDPVVSLREIASDNIKIDVLRESLIRKLQTNNKLDQIDEETLHVVDSAMIVDQDEAIDYTSDDSDFFGEESEVNDLDDEDSINSSDLDDFNSNS